MNPLLKFSVLIEPKAATRPQFNRQSGKAYHTKVYKQFRKDLEAELRGCAPEEPFDFPIDVAMGVYLRRPRTTKLVMPKPDVDNFAKGVLDAMQGPKGGDRIVLADDSWVAGLFVQKRWASPGEPGFITIRVTEAPL